jgi:hypothetical protein
MREGRIKETRRGVGAPDLRVESSSEGREETRTEVVGGVVIVSPPKGTPVIQSLATVPQRARRKPRQSSAGAAAAAAYVEPKTLPPVHQERPELVAVLLADDIDSHKVPTEPSLSRRDSRPLADIASLPPVPYQTTRRAWPWLIVATLGGLVGYWVFARALTTESAVQLHGQKSSAQLRNADSVNPAATPTKISPSVSSASVEPSATASDIGAAAVSPSASAVLPSAVLPNAQVEKRPSPVSEPAPARPSERVMSGSKGRDFAQPNAPASEKPPSPAETKDRTVQPPAPSATTRRPSDVWLE